MRFFFLYFLLFTLFTDNRPLGNPRYDFPELIVNRYATEFAYEEANLEAKMNGLAISGYYAESMRYEDTVLGAKEPVRLALKNKRVTDARKLILQEARKYRILLVNESHIRPQHRLFTKSLLEELHERGYNVFMAEGISLKNTVDSKGYPVSNDGALLNEPSYASLLRYARKVGYKIYAYEYYGRIDKPKYWDDSIKLDKYGSVKYISYDPKDSSTLLFDEHGLKMSIFTSVREEGQANNIYKVIKQNPRSKFVIHVGMGHLYESGPMMGAHLRQLLNQEDLLTISQIELDDKTAIIDTLANVTVKRDFPYLLWDSAYNRYYHFYNGAQVDYTIFNAEIRDSLFRPGFLFKDVEKRHICRLPVAQVSDCPCIFSAYDQQEFREADSKAIAIDVTCFKNESQAPLLLYKGNYTIVKKNRKGIYTNFNLAVK